MDDKVKSQFFRDLLGVEVFNAQIALEDEIQNSLLNKLMNIDLTKTDVQLEYAKLRGGLDAIKSIKMTRERLVDTTRSRNPNS